MGYFASLFALVGREKKAKKQNNSKASISGYLQFLVIPLSFLWCNIRAQLHIFLWSS